MPAKSPLLVVLLLAFLLIVIAGTIMITQAMRKVPVQYARQVRGNKVYGGQTSFLPMRVNYSGVMPIIFASSLLLFPGTILGFFKSETAAKFSSMLSDGLVHYSLYAMLVFFFSYFWVAMVFNPTQIADDMKKSGGFIPGVRPGLPTAAYLDYSMTRLTFAGACFLTILAILPTLVNRSLQIPQITTQFFGGTGLLIVVGTMLDTLRQAETYLLQRHYEGFMKKGRVRGRTMRGGPATSDTISADKYVWFLVILFIIFIVIKLVVTLGKR
jgi:preprotein translocase subunit SecY